MGTAIIRRIGRFPATSVSSNPGRMNSGMARKPRARKTARPAPRAGGREKSAARPEARKTTLRIVGGEFRGRPLAWTGDPVTRPMKDNIREAVFNLVGGWIPGKHVFDLFAGSGAIGLEAISRGALRATLIERHFPTARLIRENIASLQIGNRCQVVTSDTFYWSRRFLADPAGWPVEPWAVFCSPPYDLFLSRQPEMIELIRGLRLACPVNSVFVVECDGRFDPERLPDPGQWRVRNYAPAQICVLRPPGDNR